jgi:uncharacterized protein YecT (DUF1311 family)
MRIFLVAAGVSLGLASCAAADGRTGQASSMPMLSAANTIEACLSRETDANPVCIGQYSEACVRLSPDGQSDAGMLRCTNQEYEAWEARLNTAYGALMQQLEPPRTTGLRESQRAWIALREADCIFAASAFEGEARPPLVSAACHLDYTADRTIRLLGWLDAPR